MRGASKIFFRTSPSPRPWIALDIPDIINGPEATGDERRVKQHDRFLARGGWSAGPGSMWKTLCQSTHIPRILRSLPYLVAKLVLYAVTPESQTMFKLALALGTLTSKD